jgi:Na+-driven multidrug efflux pump
VFLSIWVQRIVLCVFVYMGSEDYFVCFCLYGFWGLFCVLPIETKTHKIILRIHRDKKTQNNPLNPYRQKHTKQSPEPIETKTHKIILRTFLSLWVLRIILCVFVSMGSGDCFVCFCLYGFWGLFCVFFSLWVLRIILCVFVYNKNTQNNPQNP